MARNSWCHARPRFFENRWMGAQCFQDFSPGKDGIDFSFYSCSAPAAPLKAALQLQKSCRVEGAGGKGRKAIQRRGGDD